MLQAPTRSIQTSKLPADRVLHPPAVSRSPVNKSKTLSLREQPVKVKAQKRSTRTSRRAFLKTVGLTGAVLFAPAAGFSRRTRIRSSGGTLDPTQIPKYRMPLSILPTMPPSGQVSHDGTLIDYYEIAARQFRQQMLPPGFPSTKVWGYGSITNPGSAARGGSFHSPAFSIEAKYNIPLRVKWINDLKDPETGRYLPPLLAVDQTLHWANPPGPRDSHASNPEPYQGPMPFVTHLHGGHTDEESDGYPEAWYLPDALSIPAGYARVGSAYDEFKNRFYEKYGVAWETGSATYQYANDQRAAGLWFHAHSLGVTRVEMYSGLAGLYFLRGGPGDEIDGVLPGAPGRGPNPYEIPLVIQDRSFNRDGSLFYPDSRVFFDGFAGPYIPYSDIAPIQNPETFGNTMLVNGQTWPYLLVEPRRYRFRILNASNTRILILQMENGLPFWHIGSDGGFLPQAAQSDRVMIFPSERADVIVDFSDIRPGSRITLLNVGPDEPFGGGTPGVDFPSANPGTTGQVLQFRVIGLTRPDTSTPPERLRLPTPPDLGSAVRTRQISFNELDSEVLPGVGPRIALLGTVDLSDPGVPAGIPKLWMDDPTETPSQNTTEVWEIYNFTEDAHPFHVHQVQFEILSREVFDPAVGAPGELQPLEVWETGRKDSLIVYPGQITRIKAHFDIAGLYVWHCHILEHEDNEMMRPYRVLPDS